MALETAIRHVAGRVKGRIGVAVSEFPNGPLLSINGDEAFRAASVIKIPILYELFRKSDAHTLDFNASHTVSSSNLCTGSGVIRLLHRPLQLTIHDLATLMIVVSDNSATNELIDVAGVAAVNSTMTSLGLNRTILRRKMLGDSGGDVSFDNDNVSSPNDLLNLLRIIHSGERLSKQSSDDLLGIMKTQQLRNKIPRYLPASLPVANKTGTVRGVSNDAAVLYLNNKTVGLVVMSMDLEQSSYGRDTGLDTHAGNFRSGRSPG